MKIASGNLLAAFKPDGNLIPHTVPVALYCHWRWPGDFRRAVEDAVLAGGDTDTTAAIVGGMAGVALALNICAAAAGAVLWQPAALHHLLEVALWLGFAVAFAAHLAEFHLGDFDVEVDAVEQGAGDAPEVVLDFAR